MTLAGIHALKPSRTLLLLLLHVPHVASLHVLFRPPPSSWTLKRRVLGRAVLGHVFVVIFLLLVIVVLVLAVVTVFLVVVGLVGRRFAVVSFCVPSVLERERQSRDDPDNSERTVGRHSDVMGLT